MLFWRRNLPKRVNKRVYKEDVEAVYKKLGFEPPEMEYDDSPIYYLLDLINMLVDEVTQLQEELDAVGST